MTGVARDERNPTVANIVKSFPRRALDKLKLKLVSHRWFLQVQCINLL